LVVTPFTAWWLKANYHWYRTEGAAIVRHILDGRLDSSRRMVPLGCRSAGVSLGGNEVEVENLDGKHTFFFSRSEASCRTTLDSSMFQMEGIRAYLMTRGIPQR
jgi:hypothetical protein